MNLLTMAKACEVCGKRGNVHAHEVCQGLQDAQLRWLVYREFTPEGFNRLKMENPRLHLEHMKNMETLATTLSTLAARATRHHEQVAPIPQTLKSLRQLEGQLAAKRLSINPEATLTDLANQLGPRKKENPDV